MEDIDYSIERGLDKNQVQRLAELSFVAEHKDLFIHWKHRDWKELSGYRFRVLSLPKRI